MVEPIVTAPAITPDTTFDHAGNRSTGRAVADILRLGLGSFAAGAGARGILGLSDMLRRTMSPPPVGVRRRSVIDIPYAVPAKTAGVTPDAGPAGPVEGAGRWIARQTGMVRPDGVSPGFGIPADKASPVDMPWAWPASAGAAIGGGAAGWHAVDSLLGAAEENETDSELEQAKAHYHAALLGQHPLGSKTASTGPDAIDQLFHSLYPEEKTAGAVDQYVGIAALLSALAGTASAHASYKHFSQGNQKNVLEAAIKQRHAQLESISPPPMIARPVPYTVANAPEDDARPQPRSPLLSP